MERALRIASVIALVIVASTASLGFNICTKSTTPIATLDRVMVNTDSDSLVVSVKPTSAVEADFTYQVDLYERGTRRATGTIVWGKVEANARQAETVSFSISSQEADTYVMMTDRQLRKTFSIKVHE